MPNRIFVNAEDVQQMVGCSKSKAYQIISTLNAELKADGYLVIKGKIPVEYFKQRIQPK